MYPMSPNKIPWKVKTFTKEETWLHRKYKKMMCSVTLNLRMEKQKLKGKRNADGFMC